MIRFTLIPRSQSPDAPESHEVKDFPALIDFLNDPQHNRFFAPPVPNTPDQRKMNAPGFIAAVLHTPYAVKENVEAVSCLVVDMDFSEAVATFKAGPDAHTLGQIRTEKRRVESPLATIAQIREVFQKAGIQAALYETLSSTLDGIRARAIVPLEAEIAPDMQGRAFAELMSFLPALAGCVDIGCGNRVSGHVYMPMGADVLMTLKCEPFAPDFNCEPLAVPPPSGFADAQKALKKDRKRLKIAAHDFDAEDLEDWCRQTPVDLKTLDLPSALASVGCIVGKAKPLANGGTKYSSTCPLAEQHTGGKSHRDEAVIFMNPGAFPVFECQHEHKVTLRDLITGSEWGGPPALDEETLKKYAEVFIPKLPAAAAEKATKIRAIHAASENGLGPWLPPQMIRRQDTLPNCVAKKSKTGVVSLSFPASQANISYIVQHDERFKDLWFCEMRGITMLGDKPFQDEMVLKHLIELTADYAFSSLLDDTKLYKTICKASLLNRRYLPTEYLRSLPKTGRNDLEFERIVLEHLGVETNMVPDFALYLKNFAVGTVARSIVKRGEFEDTAKMDDMLILTGGQGAGKSTFIRSLVPESWMAAEISPPRNGDYNSVQFVAKIQRGWVNEMAEVERAFKQHEDLKAFLSTRSDIVQLKFLNGSVAFPRRCAFIGTSNSDALLEDPTGSRRMFIVDCAVESGFFIKPMTPAQRDAFWMAAIAAFEAGDDWWLDKAHETRKNLRDKAQNHKMKDDALSRWVIKTMLKGVSDWTQPFQLSDLMERARGDQNLMDALGKINETMMGTTLVFAKVETIRMVKWVNGKTTSGPRVKRVTFETWELARALGIVSMDDGPQTLHEFRQAVTSQA